MNKIDQQLQTLKAAGRTGLMTHVIVGYPSLEATAQLVIAMEAAGADFVELQIPFSDPLADGPIIQQACEAALANGTKVSDAFMIAKGLAGKVKIPLLFMSYFNTVYKYGVERFCADAVSAGISGVIIPDAPLEAAEHEGLLDSCRKHDIHNIITLAPTSTSKRLSSNKNIASGFVYCMSRQGVTGTHLGLDPAMQQYLATIRQHISAPLAVGFGISNRERFQIIAPHSDIIVIGSAIIDVINKSKPEAMAQNVKAFLEQISN